MKIEFDGFDELIKQLDKMEKGAKELERDNEVSFEDLFTNAFMIKNTKQNSIESFFESSPFDTSSNEAFEQIDENKLDKYVNGNSKFATWQDMLGQATEEYALKKLGL